MPTLNSNVDFCFITPGYAGTPPAYVYTEGNKQNTIFFNSKDNEIYVGNKEVVKNLNIIFEPNGWHDDYWGDGNIYSDTNSYRQYYDYDDALQLIKDGKATPTFKGEYTANGQLYYFLTNMYSIDSDNNIFIGPVWFNNTYQIYRIYKQGDDAFRIDTFDPENPSFS